ncbi:DDE-type integrase/transposase/recombinase [Roseovarius sp. MMSF_3281]|uniref:DDE-type integrase/transposase/recombinase n=1 Tax=Roseovarius sp. MMSF_3281 TaxID=3046694 RepID=UPI00273F38A3|nr:DDE-type integrase/transposase/recombinase [Roseovarius sp. MMSF_3281]
MQTVKTSYKRHRFPPQIIAHVVWLYARFNLRLREVEELLIKLMQRWGFVPKRIIMDKLRSYGAAKREVAPGLDHWSHKRLNNRAENSHLPFRKRERVMQGFRSPGRLQRFVSMQSATRNSFSVPARRRSALTIRSLRLEAFETWKSAANVA